MPVPNTRKSRKLGNNRKHVPSPKKFNEIKSEVVRGIQRRGEGGRAAGRAISGRTDYGVTDRACEPQVPREGGPFFSPKLIERRRRRLPVKIGPLIRQKSSLAPSLPPRSSPFLFLRRISKNPMQPLLVGPTPFGSKIASVLDNFAPLDGDPGKDSYAKTSLHQMGNQYCSSSSCIAARTATLRIRRARHRSSPYFFRISEGSRPGRNSIHLKKSSRKSLQKLQ